MVNKVEKFDRQAMKRYVQKENTVNNWNVSDEAVEQIVNLIEYFGIDLYRPITRLLLCNWNELTERIARYTPEDWEMAEHVQAAEDSGLDRFSIAMLMEVMEGADTFNQAEKNVKPISAEELAAIRKAQDDIE